MGTWKVLGTLAVAAALASGQQDAEAQLNSVQRADLALSLLPEKARHAASVVFRNQDGEEVYRDAAGPFLCVSDTSTADQVSMICHHKILESRLRFERTLSSESGLTGAAFRERLCREVEGSELDVPPGSMEITASLARDDQGRYADKMTVYHLLWVPDQSSATLGVPERDPGDGRPFLHQAESCGAHVMWSESVPVRVGR